MVCLVFALRFWFLSLLGGPGGDLLFHVLGRSTIGAEGFHGRVRDGIGCFTLAMATRSPQQRRAGSFRRGLCVCVRFVWVDRGYGGLGLSVRTTGVGSQAVRAIRTGQLHALPRVHIRPIDVVVFHGSWGDLVLRLVSRLDAFSGYPFRT